VLPEGSVELPWSPEEAAQELYTVQREYRILTHPPGGQDALGRTPGRAFIAWSTANRPPGSMASRRLLPAPCPRRIPRRAPGRSSPGAGFVFERDSFGPRLRPPAVAAFRAQGRLRFRALVMAMISNAGHRTGPDASRASISHAMLRRRRARGWAAFPFKGREYLVAETTARVGLGMIDSTQADFRSGWVWIWANRAVLGAPNVL